MSKANTDSAQQLVRTYFLLVGLFTLFILLSYFLSWTLHQRNAFTQVYCREYFGRCAHIYPAVAISVWWPFIRAIGVGGLGVLLLDALAATLALRKLDSTARSSFDPLKRFVYISIMLVAPIIVLGLGVQISSGRGLWHPTQQSIPLINIGTIISMLSLSTLLFPSANGQLARTMKKSLLISLGASLTILLAGWIAGAATRHHSEYTEIQCYYSHCVSVHPLGAFFAEWWPRLMFFGITATGILSLGLIAIVISTKRNEPVRLK